MPSISGCRTLCVSDLFFISETSFVISLHANVASSIFFLDSSPFAPPSAIPQRRWAEMSVATKSLRAGNPVGAMAIRDSNGFAVRYQLAVHASHLLQNVTIFRNTCTIPQEANVAKFHERKPFREKRIWVEMACQRPRRPQCFRTRIAHDDAMAGRRQQRHGGDDYQQP